MLSQIRRGATKSIQQPLRRMSTRVDPEKLNNWKKANKEFLNSLRERIDTKKITKKFNASVSPSVGFAIGGLGGAVYGFGNKHHKSLATGIASTVGYGSIGCFGGSIATFVIWEYGLPYIIIGGVVYAIYDMGKDILK